ncbi:hypothetical protein EV177_003434 [Coemansia sp. RSA 1804]|nr:hypothetical protein EV177_003434 [Coemansia sp. RSA 1804]
MSRSYTTSLTIPHGNFVFAGSCSQFFTCANGFGWLQDCPGDLLFDSSLMECVWHEQVDCEGRPVARA